MSNGMTPFGYRHSRLSLDQRPVKDEVETDSEGEYVSDFTGLTAEEAKLTNATINTDDECDVAKLTSAEMNLHEDAQGSTAHHKHHHGDSAFGGNIDDGGHEHESGDQSHTHRPFTGGKPTFGRTNSAEYGKIEDKPAARDMGGEKFERYDDDGEPAAYDQRDAPELDKQHSDYPDEDDDFDYLDARRNDEQEEEEEQFDDESPEDAQDAGGPDEPDFHLDKAEQGFHNTVHGSSAASMALSKSQEIIRKFSAGPAAIALAPAPNVFRDDSPYGGGGGAGRASGGGGGARQQHSPVSRPQVGQSMGGARAGQPRGGMQPKRTIAYAEED